MMVVKFASDLRVDYGVCKLLLFPQLLKKTETKYS